MSANTVAPISTNPLAVSHRRNSWSGWTSFLIGDGLALVIIASHDYDHICLKGEDRTREIGESSINGSARQESGDWSRSYGFGLSIRSPFRMMLANNRDCLITGWHATRNVEVFGTG